MFKRYFHSVFTKENDFRSERTALEKGTDLKEIKTSVEVKNMLEDLDVRKAMGPDGVSSWILKECSSQLVSVLHNIISTTLVKGRVPIHWKWVDITTIHKTGSKEDPLNYRPVSLTSVVVKIYEKIIKNRYLEDRLSRKDYQEEIPRRQQGDNRETVWLQKRKILCYEFDKFLLKSNRYSARERWMDQLHILRSEKSI